ncbi:conserved protein, UPF0235 family [Escherichia coli]|nr:conserved protein, UPF0235 family [Escherichia coli]
MMTVWFYGSIFSRKPAVILLSVYMATKLKSPLPRRRLTGQANSHLVKFLGKQFRVAKSQVVIEKGELGRHKQIKIINPQQIPPEIAALIN